jgi:DNA-binding PadR family transcriptional regulator
MAENKITSDLLRGHTDTIILRILLEDDRYGYEITRLVQQRSDREYELKEATLYSSLKRLETDGCISWYWGDESQGGRRKYYHITKKGQETLSENLGNWQLTKRVLDLLLGAQVEA